MEWWGKYVGKWGEWKFVVFMGCSNVKKRKQHGLQSFRHPWSVEYRPKTSLNTAQSSCEGIGMVPFPSRTSCEWRGYSRQNNQVLEHKLWCSIKLGRYRISSLLTALVEASKRTLFESWFQWESIDTVEIPFHDEDSRVQRSHCSSASHGPKSRWWLCCVSGSWRNSPLLGCLWECTQWAEGKSTLYEQLWWQPNDSIELFSVSCMKYTLNPKYVCLLHLKISISIDDPFLPLIIIEAVWNWKMLYHHLS